LIRLKEWFISHDCYDVCMESTGKYWIPIYNLKVIKDLLSVKGEVALTVIKVNRQQLIKQF